MAKPSLRDAMICKKPVVAVAEEIEIVSMPASASRLAFAEMALFQHSADLTDSTLDESQRRRDVGTTEEVQTDPSYLTENPDIGQDSQSYITSFIGSSEHDGQEEGKWGYVVVLGSAIIFFVTLGLVYSYGILQAELLSRHYSSASTLGWVSSTSVVILPILAVPITALIKLTSNRCVALLGALCTGFGYIATSYTFSSPVVYLFLAQSLFGLGYAFNFWSCNSLAGEYFVKRRALALGVVFGGSGLGGAVFTIGLSKLIERYGLENGVRYAGVLALIVMIPASRMLKSKSRPSIQRLRLGYLRQTNFNLIFFAIGLVTFSLYVPPFYLPSYAVSAGWSPKTGSYLLAGYNLASFVGRIMFGSLADSRIGPLTSLCLAMILMATSILAIWIASSGVLIPLIFFLLINGAATGAIISLQPATLAHLYGVDEMQDTTAMLTTSEAAGAAFGAPIAGILLDAFGGPGHGVEAFTIPLLVTGLISLMASASVMLLRFRVGGTSLKKRI